MGTRRFSILVVLFSLIGGMASFIVGEVLVAFWGGFSEYLLIGLYFGGGALWVSGMLVVSQMISPQLIGYRWRSNYLGNSLKLFIPSTLIMVGVGAMVMQFIYGFEINKTREIKDIVVVIDTSGSMNETDPLNLRFEAVKEMISTLKRDKRVALVTFDDTPNLIFDLTEVNNPTQMNAVTAKIDGMTGTAQGSTEVKAMLTYVYNLIEKEQDLNRAASVIILSDGEPSDGAHKDVLTLVENYRQAKIPIYTIGMMYKTVATERFLSEVAAYTGGRHLSISGTDSLRKAFDNIRYFQETRNLVGERAYTGGGFLPLGFIRMIMLIVIGGLIALGQGFIFDNRFLAKGLILGGCIGAFGGSLLLELMLSSYMSPILARLVFWAVYSLCLPMFTWIVEFKESYHGTLSA